jgi:hypothetical protein
LLKNQFRYNAFGRTIVMMSERVIALRRRLAERMPNLPILSGNVPEKSRAGWSPDLHVHALIRNLARGAITELVAEKNSSGSAFFIASLLQQAAETNQIVALVDGHDSFDPAGFTNETLARLLWVRCQDAAQALKATDLILRDRNLPLVALDLRINPESQLRKIPATTWYRWQRMAEAASATLLVLTPRAMVGSAEVRLNLQNQFDLASLQKSQRELLAELRIEIARNRLQVTPPEQQIATDG